MRVAILGVGGVGRTLVSELRNDPQVESLLLIDQMGDRARVLAGMPGRVSIEAKELNIGGRPLLAKALKKCDIVVNATLPKFNMAVMGAALDAGVNYLDLAALGAEKPGDVPGIFRQLELHDRFKSAGLMALLSMGLDPGMSNVLARDAADKLDTVDSIRVRSGGVVSLPGFTSFPLYSREAFLSDILLRPTIWLDGELHDREPMGEMEEFPFPPPVGPQRTFLMSHEEVKTLPKYVGKPVRRVDFKYALDPNLVHALLSLEKLGLLREDRMIKLGGQVVPFRRALIAAFPEPSAMVLPLEGTKCVSVEVEGTKGDARVVRRADITLAHHEANRRRSTTAVYYLTAVGAAIGVGQLGANALPGPGVYPPEVLDPARVIKEWESRDIPLARSERAIAA